MYPLLSVSNLLNSFLISISPWKSEKEILLKLKSLRFISLEPAVGWSLASGLFFFLINHDMVIVTCVLANI